MPKPKSHHHLVDYALACGLKMSVSGGVKQSSNRAAIIADLEACDENTLSILSIGWALVINDNTFEPEEHVADHSANAWFDDWSKAYDTACGTPEGRAVAEAINYIDFSFMDVKHAMLLALTKWADSEEGRDYRAGLAANSTAYDVSAVTAEDVLALLDDDKAAELREELGLSPVNADEEE